MDELLEQQLIVNQNMLNLKEFQTEQIFEIDTVLRDIHNVLNTGIIDLFTMLDDNVKVIIRNLTDSNQSVSLGDVDSPEIDDTVSTQMIDEYSDKIIDSIDSNTRVLVEALQPKETEEGHVLTREDFIEARRLDERTADLLEQLAENRSASPGDGADGKADSWVSSFIGAAMGGGFLARLIGRFRTGLLALFSVKAITASLGAGGSIITRFFGPILSNFNSVLGGFFSKSVFVKFLAPLTRGLFRVILSPLNLIIGTFMGLKDAVNEYIENGSILGAVKAFFGGIINWFTFGIIDKDFSLNTDGWVGNAISGLMNKMDEWIWQPVKKWFVDLGSSIMGVGQSISTWVSDTWALFTEKLDIIPEAFSKLSGIISENLSKVSTFVTDNVIDPVIKLFTDVVSLFETYIKNPIVDGITALGAYVRDNVIDPIINAFTGIKDFVIDLKDKVLGIFDNFSIPEIGFTIPGIGKKVSVGPWYPFRSDTSDTNETISEETVTNNLVNRRNETEIEPIIVRPNSRASDTNETIQAEILKPTSTAHDSVYEKSSEVDRDKQIVVMPSTNVVAPTTNTTVNTTNNSVKVPVRNKDSSLFGYLGRMFNN